MIMKVWFLCDSLAKSAFGEFAKKAAYYYFFGGILPIKSALV